MNDLTNRELIRKKFKFEEFKINDDFYKSVTNNYNIYDEDEDDIIQGSRVFVSPSLPQETTNNAASKDVTENALFSKNHKREFFQSKNR